MELPLALTPGAGETTQGFRALAGFAKDPDKVLRTHGSAHKLHFRGSGTLFCPLQVLGT